MDYDVIVAGAGPGRRRSSLAGELVFTGGIAENAPEIRALATGLGFSISNFLRQETQPTRS